MAAAARMRPHKLAGTSALPKLFVLSLLLALLGAPVVSSYLNRSVRGAHALIYIEHSLALLSHLP